MPTKRSQQGRIEEEWEESSLIIMRSEDDAWYELDRDWLSDDLRAVICKAIVRLPSDVQDFALNNCTFIEFGNHLHGLCFDASFATHPTRRGRTNRNHYVILLNVGLVKNEKRGQLVPSFQILQI